MRKSIAVIGGSFNPVHTAHVAMVDATWKQLTPHSVMVIPSYRHPFKNGETIVSYEDRKNMLALALADRDFVTVCDVEKEEAGVSYTVRTLEILHKRYEPVSLFFVCGEDLIFQLHQWKNPERLMELTTFAVLKRPGHTEGALQEQIDHLRKTYGARFHFLDFEPMEVSSSMIRKKLRMGCSVEGLTPHSVIRYIEAKGLYTKEQHQMKE